MLESIKYEDTGTKIPEIAKFLEREGGVSGKFTDTELANIADLGLDTESKDPFTSEQADVKISGRFDEEVRKAGIGSYDAAGLADIKKQFDQAIQGTPDMKTKLKLYSAFMEELAGKVGTTVAEQNQRSQQNTQNMEAERTENARKAQSHSAEILLIAQEFRQMKEDAISKRRTQEQQQQQKARSGGNREAQISQASAESLTFPA